MHSLSKIILVLAALAVCASGTTFVDTCTYYIPSPDYVCNGNSDESQALEIQNVLTSMISAASGSNMMTYDEFITYPSQVGIYSLNTPRNLQFSSNCFFKSPNAPPDCSSTSSNKNKQCITINTIKSLNDTTWGELALNACASYYPSNSTDVVLGPAPAGQVLVAPINKCQNMTFTETQAWILTDQWKNQYIMHASGANTTDGVDDAAEAAVFPAGWSVAQVNLTSPFTISPRMTSDGECYYTIIRDSQDNSYHQFSCGGTTFATDFNPACPAATQSGYVPGSTPSPAPSPPAPSTKKCTYSGNYNIMPQLLNCAGQYLAWDSPSNCTHNDVSVKTKEQLGGKSSRASWAIKGEARKNLNIVGAKNCANNMLDVSLNGIVLGSTKFPWQIQPVGNDCNTVNIVAPTRKGAKYLGMRVSTMPGNCSKKFGFTSTAGPQNVFKLAKA